MNNTNNNCCQNGNNSQDNVQNESIQDNKVQNSNEQKSQEKKRTTSFVLKASLMEYILMLPAKISCHMMKAVFLYKMTGEIPSFKEVEDTDDQMTCNAFFLAILPQIGKVKRFRDEGLGFRVPKNEGKLEEDKGSQMKIEEDMGEEDMSEEDKGSQKETEEDMGEEDKGSQKKIEEDEGSERFRDEGLGLSVPEDKGEEDKAVEEEPFGDGRDDFRRFFNDTVRGTGIMQMSHFNTQNMMYRRRMKEFGKKGLAKVVRYCAAHPRHRGEWVTIDWMLNENNFRRIMNDEMEKIE